MVRLLTNAVSYRKLTHRWIRIGTSGEVASSLRYLYLTRFLLSKGHEWP